MVCPSPDDDIMHSDSATHGIQVSESLERETSAQWPSPTFYGRNWTPIEPSQNKRPARLQLVTKHWLPSGRHVDLPDGHITLANLTGRSYAEVFQDLDFDCLHRPRESSPCTPSLTSDDSHSHDSPSCSTPRNINKYPSLSPKLVSQASFENNDYSEAELSLPVHSIEIDSTTKSDNASAPVILPPTLPNASQMDVTKGVESRVAYHAPESSIPPSEPPPRLRRSESTSLKPAVSKLGPSTVLPTVIITTVAESHTEQDDLMDDAYLPEPPTSGSESKTRTKKHSKSSTFECPQCLQHFTRNFDMQRHIKTVHAPQTREMINAYTCMCGKHLSRKDAFKRHIERIPTSCRTVAKRSRKPEPPRLPKEMYETYKAQMLTMCTRQS